jgi:hypothetical protein
MRLRTSIVILAAGLGLAAPATAAERDPLAAFDPAALLQGLVREEDVAALFAHLRAALLAAAEGREAPPADALARRAEAIGGELKLRGALAGALLLQALEAQLRQALREAAPRARPLPPVAPQVPVAAD